MQTVDPDAGPVERSSLVKGYAIDKGLYVTLTDVRVLPLHSPIALPAGLQLEQVVMC